MQPDKVVELTVQQLKRRQISEEYLKIQENTESLTQINRYSPKIKKNVLKFNQPIDIRTFFNVLVQTTYLLYTCLLRKTNLFISQQFYAKNPRKGEIMNIQQVYCEYILELQFAAMSASQKQIVSKSFKNYDLGKSSHSYGQYICQMIAKAKVVLKPHLERAKNSPDGYLFRQMEGLNFLMINFIYPQIRNLEPKILILCLEESELFRQFSMLLKCLNSSIFAALRFQPQSKQIFKELVQLQGRIIFNSSKRDMLQTAKRVQTSIEECVKMLLKYNIVASEQSLNETTVRMDTSAKPYLLGQLQGNNPETRKYYIRLYVKQKPFRNFTAKTLQAIITKMSAVNLDQQQKQKQKGVRSQYLIQFYSGKGLLCVKYVTTIELNIETTDMLMFHCNYMSYNWNNVTLQFIDKSSGKSKRKQRFLAFKTVSYLNLHQKIIFKILTMMDLLMVYAKLADQHLRRGIFNMDDYYQRSNQLNNQCEHMKKMFIRKVEKNYQTIQENMHPQSE